MRIHKLTKTKTEPSLIKSTESAKEFEIFKQKWNEEKAFHGPRKFHGPKKFRGPKKVRGQIRFDRVSPSPKTKRALIEGATSVVCPIQEYKLVDTPRDTELINLFSTDEMAREYSESEGKRVPYALQELPVTPWILDSDTGVQGYLESHPEFPPLKLEELKELKELEEQATPIIPATDEKASAEDIEYVSFPLVSDDYKGQYTPTRASKTALAVLGAGFAVLMFAAIHSYTHPENSFQSASSANKLAKIKTAYRNDRGSVNYLRPMRSPADWGREVSYAQ